MPTADYAEIQQNPDGSYTVKLDTGEVYKGSPMDVINGMGKSYVFGKEWAQGLKSQNEKLKTGQAAPQ